MADRQRLENALIAADAAGDLEAAQMLAQELRRMDQAPVEAVPEVSPQESFMSAQPELSGQSFEAQDATMGQQLQLAAGFLLNAKPEARKDMIKNILGDEASFTTDDTGRDIVTYGNERAYINRPGFDIRDATQLIGEVLKFAPAAKVAQITGGPGLAMFGKGASALRSAIGGGTAAMVTQAASDKASEAFGSEQGIDPLGVGAVGLGAMGGELAAGPLRRLAPKARETIDRIRSLGIDPRGTPGQQVGQVARTAQNMASPEPGAAFPAVAAGVQKAREATRKAATQLYDTAQGARASIPAKEVAGLQNRVANKMDSFILEADGMNGVSRSMNALTELADETVPFPRKIQALERWRGRVSAMNPKDGSPADAASKVMLREYDEWMDDVFNRDMLSGDPTAVDAWRNARSAWKSYKDRFDSNRVIRDLAKKDTTPEQMSQWLFNSNAVGAKREAGLVVNRLNDILGKDSKPMADLRSEVILDIAEPLFRDTPDIKGFVTNYDKFLRKNPTLQKSLFPDNFGKDLEDLYRFSQTISKRAGASTSDLQGQDAASRVIRLANRLMLGHGIARGGAKIEGGNVLANFVRRKTSGSANRLNMVREYLGIEPTIPLLPMPTAVGASTVLMEDRPLSGEENVQ